MKHHAVVVTCSDRAASEVYEDRSGSILREALRDLGFMVADAVIVPDEKTAIQDAIRTALSAGARVIITTGGTGVGPRDITVEATKDFLSYEIPGLMEEIRRYSVDKEPRALLSRGLAGVIRPDGAAPTLLVNAPGSRGGARDTIAVIGPLLHHIVDQLDGKGHELD